MVQGSPKIACRLLGCVSSKDPGCDRCNTGIYDAEFIQEGWLDPAQRAWWLVRTAARKLVGRVIGKKCQVCGARYWSGDDWTCSDKCFADWLPF